MFFKHKVAQSSLKAALVSAVCNVSLLSLCSCWVSGRGADLSMQVASKQGSRVCDSEVEISAVVRFFFGDGAKSLVS